MRMYAPAACSETMRVNLCIILNARHHAEAASTSSLASSSHWHSSHNPSLLQSTGTEQAMGGVAWVVTTNTLWVVKFVAHWTFQFSPCVMAP